MRRFDTKQMPGMKSSKVSPTYPWDKTKSIEFQAVSSLPVANT